MVTIYSSKKTYADNATIKSHNAQVRENAFAESSKKIKESIQEQFRSMKSISWK